MYATYYGLVSHKPKQGFYNEKLCIWRSLNHFLIRLDVVPYDWESRVAYFAAYLVNIKKVQSSMLRSYISAIKHILKCDGYEWNDQKIWLNALLRACKLANDTIETRFPIHFKLLEMILFELTHMYNVKQPYLESLYQAMFCLAYYGLMRISKLTQGPHTVKAKNIQVAENKDKIKVILYSSKMHDKSSIPQEIKISSKDTHKHLGSQGAEKFFCPFQLLRLYMRKRGPYCSDSEQFFIFADRSPVQQHQVRHVLKCVLTVLKLDHHCYNFQSMHIGRGTDLLKFGFNIETIK